MSTDTVEEADPAPRDKRRLILILSLAGGTVLLFLLLAWPTLYRYPADTDRFRVHRLTGKAEAYDRKTGDWRPARRGRNPGGTGGSPYDGRGPRSGGAASGGQWWHDGKASGSKPKGAGGNQWWYSEEDGDRSPPPSDGSPIGSSRGRGGGGGGGGSPIGGSRSGGDSPVGGGGSGGGSPIGGD